MKIFFLFPALVLLLIGPLDARGDVNSSARERLWYQISADTFPSLTSEAAGPQVLEFMLQQLRSTSPDSITFVPVFNRAYYFSLLTNDKTISDSLFTVAQKKYPKVFAEILGYRALSDWKPCFANKGDSCRILSDSIQPIFEQMMQTAKYSPAVQWQHLKQMASGELMENEESARWIFREKIPADFNAPGYEGGIVAIEGAENFFLLVVNNGPRYPIKVLRASEEGSWSDVTKSLGLENFPGGNRMYVFDYNGDGLQDLLILRNPSNPKSKSTFHLSLLENNSNTFFVDVTVDKGWAFDERPTCACVLDADGDGELEIFLGNAGSPARLMKSDGTGKWVDVALQHGINTDKLYISDCAVYDINQDGWNDLYLSVDRDRNRAYTREVLDSQFVFFVDRAEKYNMQFPSLGGLLQVGDFDGNGYLDLLTLVDATAASEVIFNALNGSLPGFEKALLYLSSESGKVERNELPEPLLAYRAGLLMDGQNDSRPALYAAGGRGTADVLPLSRFQYYFVPVPESKPVFFTPENLPPYVHSTTVALHPLYKEPVFWFKGGGSYPMMAADIVGYTYAPGQGAFHFVLPKLTPERNALGAVVQVLMTDATGALFIKTRRIAAVDSKGSGAGQYWWWVPEGFKIHSIGVRKPNSKSAIIYQPQDTSAREHIIHLY